MKRLFLSLVSLSLLALACSLGATATPAPPTTRPTDQPTTPAAQQPCGDNICDAAEQADPSLCPGDCPISTQSVQSPTPPTTRPPDQPTATTRPPDQPTTTFTTVLSPTELPLDSNVDLWLYAIDDGLPQLALSAERGGEAVVMGRFDPNNPTAAVNWQVVADGQDTGGVNIADHWHIFAHDRHWIVFSTGPATTSYLLQLDRDFNRLGLTVVADRDPLTDQQIALQPPKPPDAPEDAGKYVITNDMFLVAEPDGVAVGHFIPIYGHRIYRFDLNGNLREKVDVGGGDYRHANASSAVATETGYIILGTEYLNVVQEGAILKIETDSNWKPLAVSTWLGEANTSMIMATGVQLPGGHWVINLASLAGAYPRGQLPPPPDQLPADFDPSRTAIVRYVVSPDGAVVSKETVSGDSPTAERPHTTLISDPSGSGQLLLVTTWDMMSRIWIRIDRIE